MSIQRYPAKFTCLCAKNKKRISCSPGGWAGSQHSTSGKGWKEFEGQRIRRDTLEDRCDPPSIPPPPDTRRSSPAAFSRNQSTEGNESKRYRIRRGDERTKPGPESRRGRRGEGGRLRVLLHRQLNSRAATEKSRHSQPHHSVTIALLPACPRVPWRADR